MTDLIALVCLLLGASLGLRLAFLVGGRLASRPPAVQELHGHWPQFMPPSHRSPYSLGLDEQVDASAGPLVRPYLTAHEQGERRRDLLLATLGVDAPGPCWIHGMEVA